MVALVAFVADLVERVFAAKGLQAAALVADAGLASAGMVGQDQLDDGAPGVAQFARVGAHPHAFLHRERTRRFKPRRARGIGDFHHAHAAGTRNRELLVVAQGGDANAQCLRGFENRRAGGNANLQVVNGQIDVGHSSSPFL